MSLLFFYVFSSSTCIQLDFLTVEDSRCLTGKNTVNGYSNKTVGESCNSPESAFLKAAAR